MKWIKRIIGFIKLYKDYEYEPEDWKHIVETYQQVLCNRTRTMSKPTYHLYDILAEMDKWYEYHDEYECGREYCEINQITDEILDILNPADYEKLLKANEKKKFGLTRSGYEM